VPISEVPQRTRMLQSDKVRRGCSGHLLQLHSFCSEVSAGRHFSRWMGSGCQGRPAPHSTASTGHMEGAEPTLPGCIGERCTENKAFLSHGCVTLKLFLFLAPPLLHRCVPAQLHCSGVPACARGVQHLRHKRTLLSLSKQSEHAKGSDTLEKKKEFGCGPAPKSDRSADKRHE
jgi:hypothetical protein